jgi:hypothetical protein
VFAGKVIVRDWLCVVQSGVLCVRGILLLALRVDSCLCNGEFAVLIRLHCCFCFE